MIISYDISYEYHLALTVIRDSYRRYRRDGQNTFTMEVLYQLSYIGIIYPDYYQDKMMTAY